jgi:hypothetical protein
MRNGFMSDLLLLSQLGFTLSLVGLIWFVQIVHYPLFAMIGSEAFAEYERCHQKKTTRVVAPLMLLEVLTAGLLLIWRPDGVAAWLPWTGLALIALIWVSTFLWQVPVHERLAAAFEKQTHLLLVRSNWLRTAGWTLRGLLVCTMCLQAMNPPP